MREAYWLASQPWYARRPDAWSRGRDRCGARLRPRDRAAGLRDAATPSSPRTWMPRRRPPRPTGRRLLDGARRARSGRRTARPPRPPPSAARSRCGSTTPACCAPSRRGSTRTTRCAFLCDVNLMGVIWGSRAAVDAMRAGPGENRHIINIASLSALGPVPGLAVYAATKHARARDSPARSRATSTWRRASRSRCTRCARTAPTRRCCASTADEPDAAIIWSGPRLLTRARRWPSTRSRCSTRRSSCA